MGHQDLCGTSGCWFVGMVTKNLAKYFEKLGITKIELLKKAALLGSARILRNMLKA